jgi:hypothetical protein
VYMYFIVDRLPGDCCLVVSSHEVFQAEQLLGEHLDLLDKVRIRYDYSTTIILSKMHLQNSVTLVLVLLIVNNV